MLRCMTHPNQALLERFYTAFQQRDHATMGDCYHPERARFSDPVFPTLEGWKIAAMWQMLCERGTDLELTFSDLSADDNQGSAHWEARYTFGGSGRKVHNIIAASFTFQDGKIIEHVDRFNLWRWSRMALGFRGWALGWMPSVHNAIRKQAAGSLESFIQKRDLGE